MTAIDIELRESIEEILRMPEPPSVGAIEGLAILTARFLDQPLPPILRPLAVEVARATGDSGEPEQEARFQAALRKLADAIDQQQRTEQDNEQFAEDPEMVQDFVIEAREHLSSVETGLLTIEKEPGNSEALNAVFRSFHSIKGLAAFLGAAAIQELAHETENVLDLARSGAIALSPEIIDLILRSADDLAACLDLAGRGKLSAIPRRDRGLLESLARATRAEQLPADESPEPARAEQSAEPTARDRSREQMRRVDAAKLEHLIDMVGELVIAESVVRHDPAVAQSQDPVLARNLKQLSRVVQEVQKTSMAMRMVAVGPLFRKMDRLTRDLTRKLGKMAELVTSGDDVELDRGIVESLADPMVHMIRNAIDHGLEMPEDRRRAGKREQGTIRLKAAH